MDFTLHLKYLKQRQLINSEIIAMVLNVKKHLQIYWQVNVETAQVEMGLIHLAMALGRIQRGCIAQALSKEIISEIKSAVCFPQILRIHTDILSLIPFEIPEDEQTHLIANWYSLVLAQPKILNE